MKRSSIFIVNDTSFSFNKQFEVNFDGSEIFPMASFFSFLPPYRIDGCRFFFVWWKIKRKYGRVEVYSIISGRIAAAQTGRCFARKRCAAGTLRRS